MVWHHPDWAASNPKLDRLAKLFIFIAIAWFLGGSTRNTLLIWGLAFIGWLIATLAFGNGLEEWWAGLQGKASDSQPNRVTPLSTGLECLFGTVT